VITKNKIVFLIVFFSCFFFISHGEASQYCSCNGLASFTCHLDENVVSGDTVNCSIADNDSSCQDCPGDGQPCDNSVSGGSCAIYAGSNQCTINNIDCGCAPATSPYFNAWTSVNNGSLSFMNYSGTCGSANFYNGYYRVDLSNPDNCTINFNYTPPYACTAGWPTISSLGSSNITANSATLNWSLSSWGQECSCANDRFYNGYIYSGFNCGGNSGWNWSSNGYYLPLTDSYTASGLSPGAQYSYRISAVNRCEESSPWGSSPCHNFTTVIDDQPPNDVQTYINSASVLADGATQYGITVNAWDPDGGGDVRNTYAMINYQGVNAGQYRGYIGWTAYQSDYPYWSNFSQQIQCSGAGGWAAKSNDYGSSYLDLVGCWSTINPNNYKMLQVSFTVKFNTNFTLPTTGNTISGWVRDKSGLMFNWKPGATFSLTTPRSWTINVQARCGDGTGPIASSYVTRMWGVISDNAPWISWVDSPATGTHSKYLTLKYDTGNEWIGMDDGTDIGNLNLSDASPPSGITKTTFGDAPVYKWYKNDLPAGTYSLNFKAPSDFCDTTPPTGTISINNGAVYTNAAAVTLKLTCADAGSGCSKMKFSNNNSTWSAEENYAASKAWTLTSGNGTKTVYVKYKDVIGNWSGSYSDTIILDTIAPDTTITQKPPNPSGSSSASFSFTSTEANSTFQCKLDAGSYASCTVPKTYTGLINGNHTFYVKATDPAGNTDATPASYTWTINQPPVANFSCTPSNCTIYTGESLVFNNNSTDPDNNLVRSEWDILKWGSAPDLTCCASGCNSTNILCNYTVQSLIVGNGIYNMKLTVRDAQSATASLTKVFNIRQDAVADFVCSGDNLSWEACNSIDFRPPRNLTIYFHDNLSDAILAQFGLEGRRSTPSQGAAISQRVWKKNSVIFSSDNNSNPSLEMTDAEADISLQVTDTAGRSASVSFRVTAGTSLPEWEEIIPIVLKTIKDKIAGLIFFWQ